MCPELKTTLYHGTIYEINAVDVSLGSSFRDFGKGFYMAVSRKQAIGMMHKKYREILKRKDVDLDKFKEHLYEVRLDRKVMETLNVRYFPVADEDWLDFVLMCRNSEGRPHDYDLIIGPTADDNTITSLNLYTEGQYGVPGTVEAKSMLLRVLKPENLGVQYYVGKQDVADVLVERLTEIDWRQV